MEAMELGRIPDEAFAFSDLKEDFVYAKIPREKRQYYIAAGLAAGRQAARTYRGKDLAALLCSDGVQIRRFSEPSPSGLHSQICYDGATKQVDLFCATAKQLSAAMNKTPCPVSPQELERLFLAHEFYHWLEYSSGVGTELRCEPIRTKLFGLLPRQVRIRRTGEIAAFVFSKEFCGLPVHPKAIDCVFVDGRAGKSFEETCARLAELEAEYRAECL